MKEWLKYVLIVVGTCVGIIFLRWIIKRETETFEDTLLLGLAFAIPISIANCLNYKINVKRNRIKNKIKNNLEENGF